MRQQSNFYLAINNFTNKWKNPPVTWKLAATQLRSSSAKRRHQHV